MVLGVGRRDRPPADVIPFGRSVFVPKTAGSRAVRIRSVMTAAVCAVLCSTLLAFSGCTGSSSSGSDEQPVVRGFGAWSGTKTIQFRPYSIACLEAKQTCYVLVRVRSEKDVRIAPGRQELKFGSTWTRPATVLPVFIRIPRDSTDLCAAQGRAHAYPDTESLRDDGFPVSRDMEATLIFDFKWDRNTVPERLRLAANGADSVEFRIDKVDRGGITPYFEGQDVVPCLQEGVEFTVG